MTRITFGLLALSFALIGLSPAAEPAPAKRTTAPLEFALSDGEKLVRIEVAAEVEGKPVSVIWDETFATLFTYFDRNADGALDAKEAAPLPSARALRQAMGNGFTPPSGKAPELAELDGNGDGKVTSDELAAYYRANGLGNVQVGVGRLPDSAELTAALLKNLDADSDGKVSEKEWKAGVESLKKLDKNDDELIGAGELVPKAVYPGASGALLLAPPGKEPQPEVVAKLPFVLLPSDAKDTNWAAEIARRAPKLKAADLPAWRQTEPAAKWAINLSEKPGAPARFAFAGSTTRVEGWIANGRVNESLASARKQFVAQLGAPEPEEGTGRRRAGGGLSWLTPIADRNGDGKLERKELDAWLDLQTQLARGQVFLTVLDGAGLFELLDANHDGALSVRELRGAWDRLKTAGCVTDGAFDAKKLPRVLMCAASWGYPQGLSRDDRRGPAWFLAMDRNRDGDVSRREFTGPAEVFDKLDLDKDGLLSVEEAEKVKTKE